MDNEDKQPKNTYDIAEALLQEANDDSAALNREVKALIASLTTLHGEIYLVANNNKVI
jgi:hypothetical protein